jgi:hypothetical protein
LTNIPIVKFWCNPGAMILPSIWRIATILESDGDGGGSYSDTAESILEHIIGWISLTLVAFLVHFTLRRIFGESGSLSVHSITRVYLTGLTLIVVHWMIASALDAHTAWYNHPVFQIVVFALGVLLSVFLEQLSKSIK